MFVRFAHTQPEYFAFAVREALLRVESVFPQDGPPLRAAAERRQWSKVLFGFSQGEENDEVFDNEEFTSFVTKLGFGDKSEVLWAAMCKWEDDRGVAIASEDETDGEICIDPHLLLRVIHLRTAPVRGLLQAWAKAAAHGAPAAAPAGPEGRRSHGSTRPASGRAAPAPALVVPLMDAATKASLDACGDDVDELLRRLRSWLRGDGSASAVEQSLSVFRTFDADGSMEISLKEMRAGLAALGCAAAHRRAASAPLA